MQVSSILFRLGSALLGAAAFACAASPVNRDLSDAERAALIEDGRLIAQQQCASCHATRATDPSPHADAPPLPRVLYRYDAAALTANVMEGIRVAHGDMPVFRLGPKGADALVEYLDSIQER